MLKPQLSGALGENVNNNQGNKLTQVKHPAQVLEATRDYLKMLLWTC